MTIHHFFRFGPGIQPDEAANRTPREPELYKALECLVVDEASMVRADLLDCVDSFLRRHGPQRGQPVGGVVILPIGDPYQLEPVVSPSERKLVCHYSSPFFWASNAYQKASFSTATLTQPFRQQDDDFLRVLDAVRDGTATEADLELFNSRVVEDLSPSSLRDMDATMLTPLRVQASRYNEAILNSLTGKPSTFPATVTGRFQAEPENQRPTDTMLRLKVGAKVMLIRNHSPAWVNGTLARVVGIDEGCGVEVEIEGSGRHFCGAGILGTPAL
jgi:hypothetical protein